MKITKLVSILAVVFAVSLAGAAEDFEFNVSSTFMSKYLWHGFDMYDDRPAVKTTLNVAHQESGAYAEVSYIMPTGSASAYEDKFQNLANTDSGYPVGQSDEWDYTFGMEGSMMQGDAMQMDADLSYTYYNFGDVSRYETFNTMAGPINQRTLDWSGEDRDLQELSLGIEFPNMISEYIVPHYRLSYIFEAGGYGGGPNSDLDQEVPFGQGVNYFEHTIGIKTMMDIDMMPLHGCVDAIYEDGRNDAADEGFKRILTGLGTQMVVGPGMVKPAVYYQFALDDEMGNMVDDDWFAAITYSIDF
ncbi:TorF family putative porin [Sedimentisphaera salicampi]|uniref:hypothetical protein n=1 Tax=Sedimentisphaera salicampi TaxID=1941349 RepID=UPI000B9A6568|nr:hypothetical protein [Sedimentisphaera salicampi]OXU14366.1 hypothetical protein SMSP1_01830 [Sedimentisphaera salicampi]